ncbi:MAG: ankyrin repeat domain-containing protein [Verrucomicrobia bacterium]|nr:ankyrin repeat domain-containing protein [Verrucomicrobiota bacterium]
MGIDSVVNEYSLIHYKQQNELKEGSLQERLVVKVDSNGKKSLDIRTLSLWERFSALFDLGPAAKSAVLECINISPQKEALADKVAFIFNENLDRPKYVVVLSSISECHNRSLLRELIERPEVKERLNDKVRDGDTALMQAIKKSNKDAFMVLVRADGVDLDAWNHEEEYTALILAIEHDRPEFVKELIAKGCKIPVKAFLEAKNHPSMLTLIKNGSNEQKSGLLVDAVENSNEAALKKIINDIHGINMVPALEHAIRYEKREMIDKLIGHGVANPEKVAVQEWAKGYKLMLEPGKTVVADLIEVSPVDSVRTSDEYRNLLEGRNIEPQMVLKAAERGNWNLVEAMISTRPMKREDASKVLLKAASRAGPSVVELLLQKGADPEYKDSRGNSALARAEQRLTHGHIPGGRDQAQAVLDLLNNS